MDTGLETELGVLVGLVVVVDGLFVLEGVGCLSTEPLLAGFSTDGLFVTPLSPTGFLFNPSLLMVDEGCLSTGLVSGCLVVGFGRTVSTG